ncbi:MAG: fluoride efflux transporter CrcB [bacterium]
MTRSDMILVANVAIGGAVGSGCRYLMGAAIQSRAGGDFPLATLIINVVGSLLLGFILEYATGSTAVSPEMRLLLSTGFCGGFTTFSTFSNESVRLIQGGEYRRATVYVGLSLILSFAAIVVGYAIARSTLGARRMA